MSLLLAADQVELFRPAGRDAAGWREPGLRPEWCGVGNLQLFQGYSDGRESGGGHGPYEPAASARGTLYLPAGVEVGDGWTARVRGQVFALSQARLVPDPLPGGGLDCQALTVVGVTQDG